MLDINLAYYFIMNFVYTDVTKSVTPIRRDQVFVSPLHVIMAPGPKKLEAEPYWSPDS